MNISMNIIRLKLKKAKIQEKKISIFYRKNSIFNMMISKFAENYLLMIASFELAETKRKKIYIYL